MLTKGAIGNLINRYRAVLEKCRLMNVFGSLAVASMLVMGGAGVAEAEPITTGEGFKTAVTDAEAGETITLGQNIEQGLGAVFKQNVTVDFAGHTYTAYAGSVGSTGTESQLFQLLKDSGAVTLKNGTLDVASPTAESGKFKMVLQNYCNLTLENMVVDGRNLQGSAPYTMSNNHGNVVINNSTIIAKEGGFAFDAYYWPSNSYTDGVSVTVNNSTIDGRIEVTVDGKKEIGENKHSLSISGGTLVGGLTATNGGQLYTVGTTQISNVAINNNTATNLGGGIYNAVQNALDGGVAGRGLLTLNDVSFSGNKASQGGAIYNAGTMKLTGINTFSDNTANGVGNDVHNVGAMTVESGVTKLNSGYTQEGASSALNVNSGSSLAVALPDMGGVTASKDEALLALGKPLALGEGKLRVGSVNSGNDAAVAFGNNSLLVVDGKAANAGAMITGSGDISVDSGSKLYIANARAGEAYTITDGLNTTEGEYWKSANLLAGRLIEAEISQSGEGDIVVKAEARNASSVLPGIIPVAALNTMVSNNQNNTDSSSAGIRFLSRAMDNVQFMPNDATATTMVNEVSRAAVTAGVQNTALRLADAGVDQLIHHLSLSFFGKENNIHKDGVDIWATPMYGNTYTHGMAASGAAVRGNYGGVTLGADAKVGEILGGKVRVGAAVNGGGGKSETRGTATSTDNEYNFGGVNLYAGWNLDSLNVMASVGYAMANHDVKMNLPASMGMGQAKADVDTNAFIADLRAEYQINTGVADILPHAGVRYTALNTESHNLKVNGSTLNSVASDTQHIVQFPIGVTVSKDIDVSGWNVKPLADVSVIPAAGEKKNTTKVSYAGIGALDSVNTRIMDSTSWAGTLGVQAEKGNFALGLNYGVQASSHETDQSVSVGISWKF